ncbi:MAG: hypothetical protein V1809_13975 [Planctomycetota bacterium]
MSDHNGKQNPVGAGLKPAPTRRVASTIAGILLAVAALAPRAAFAAGTFNWIGTGDGVSWNDINNWSDPGAGENNEYPGQDDINDVAVIVGDFNVTANVSVTIDDIQVDAGSTVTMNSGITLTIVDDILIPDNGDGVARIIGAGTLKWTVDVAPVIDFTDGDGSDTLEISNLTMDDSATTGATANLSDAVSVTISGNFTLKIADVASALNLPDNASLRVLGSMTWIDGQINVGTTAANVGAFELPAVTIPAAAELQIEGNTCAVKINGDLTLNGTLDLQSDTMTVDVAGHYIHNTGGVLLSATAATIKLSGSGKEIRGTLAGGPGIPRLNISGNYTIHNDAMAVTVSTLFQVSNGGTFNFSSGALTVSGTGDFTNNGTVNLDTGTFALADEWVNNGTFNSGQGTVVLNTGNSMNIAGTANTHTFYNLTINKTAAIIVDIEAGDNIIVNGLMDIQSGIFRFNNTNDRLELNGTPVSLQIADTANAQLQAITAGTSPIINCAGDITLLGAATGLLNLNYGIVIFDGGTDSTLTLGAPASGAREFQDFQVSKTGTGRVTLSSSILVEGDLTITDGLLAWGANTITIQGSFLNQATEAGEGFDASNASATLTWTGTVAKNLDAGGDPLNILNVSGTNTLQLASDIGVGAGPPAVTALNVTAGSLDLNGHAIQVEPGEKFEFNSTGTLTAGDDSGITRRGGSGTFSFEFKQGLLNITNLNFSYGDANGFFVNASGAVTFSNFDNVKFSHGTATHMKIALAGGSITYTDATWVGHAYDYNTASPDIPGADVGNPYNITTVAGTPAGPVTLNAFTGDGAGNNVAATAETNDVDGGTTTTWDDTQILLMGTFNGSTDVSWARNGVKQIPTYTTNSSPYSFNVTGKIASGDIITIFYDNNAAGTDAAVITIATGASMTGLNLTQSQVWLGSHGGASLTNANLDLFDEGQDSDVPFVVTGGNLTFDSAFSLRVFAGSTYTPGGNIAWAAASASNNVNLSGTMNLNANTLSVCTAMTVNSSGAFVMTTGSATFNNDSTSSDVIIDGALDFGSGGTLSVGDYFTINATASLTPGAGTLAMMGTTDNSVLGGTKNTITIHNLVINKTDATDTVAVENNDTVAVNGDFTLTNGEFLLDASETLDIGGAITIPDNANSWFNVTGVGAALFVGGNIACGTAGKFDVNGGTLTFDGAANATVNTSVPGADRNFFAIRVNKSGGGKVTLASSIDVNSHLVIDGGVLDSDTFDITLAGSFTNNATGADGFDFSDPATDFTFDGAGAQNVTSGGDAFNTVTMNGAGSLTLSDNMTVGVGIAAGDSLTVNTGMLNLNGQTLAVQSGTRFVFSSSTASPNGALRSTSAASTLTRNGAGTWTMLMEEGQVDIAGLNVSYMSGNGFDIVPAGGGVRVLQFDDALWSNCATATQYIRLADAPTFTDTTWSGHDFPAGPANNVATAAGSTGGPITMLNSTGALGGANGEANDNELGIIIAWAIEIALQGTCDGVTDISWARNGILQSTYTTNASPYSFTGITNLSAGDIIAVWYEGGAVKGAVVTTATGGNQTDLNLTTNRVVVRNDNGGSGLTNANLDTAHTGDADIPYTDGGGAALTVANNTDIEVRSGGAYAPGGTVTLQGTGTLRVNGTMTAGGTVTTPGGVVIEASGELQGGSYTIAASGNWTNNRGTAGFVEGTSLVQLASTAQVTTNETFSAIEVTGGTPSIAAAKTVSCVNFTMNAGTSFTANDDAGLTVTGAFAWGAGTFYFGTTGGNDLGVFSVPALTIPAGLTLELFGTAATSLTVNGNLTVNGTLNFNSNTLTLATTGHWIHNTGGSLAGSGSSTVKMTGSGAEIQGTLAGGTVFQNLTIGGSVTLANTAMQIRTQGDLSILGSSTFSAGSGAVDVDQDLIIDGTLNANTGTFTLGRNFTNNGAFTANTSSFTLDTATAAAIGGTANSHTFNVLIIGKTAAADIVDIESGDTVTVGGLFTINAGTLRLNDTEALDLNGAPTSLTIANTADAVIQATAGTPTIRVAGHLTLTGGAGAAGKINLDAGTIEFDDSSAATVSTGTASNGSRDFYNFKANKSGAGSVTIPNGYNLDVDGSVTIQDGILTLGTNTVTVAGSFTNSASGAEGFDATGTTVTLDGTGTQAMTSNGDTFTTLNMNGSGTCQLADTFTATTVTVNSGSWDLNGKTMQITSGGSFLHSSSTASPNGSFRATVSGSTATSVSGTFSFTVDQGQIDISSLAFSKATANGFYINPAAAADVNILNFDGIVFTGGATTHVKIGANCAAATFTDTSWVTLSFDYNLAEPNIPPVHTGNPRNVTSVAGSTGTITLIGFIGNGAGAGIAADAESNESQGGTVINWDDTQKIITGTFDGTTDVRIVSTDAAGVSTVRGTYSTDSSPYSFNVTAWIAANQLLTIFYNNDVAGTDAVVVTVATGNTMSGLNVQAGEVRIHDGNASAMTNALLDPSDLPYDGVDDTDIPYTITSGTNAITFTAGTKVRVMSGQAYTPGGNVTWTANNASNDMYLDGTMNVGAETVDKMDDCAIASAGKLDITGAGTVNVRNALTADGAVDGGSGTLKVGGNFTLNNTGTFTAEAGTVELNLGTTLTTYVLGGTKNTIAFNHLTVNKTDNSVAVNVEDNDTISVAGTFALTKGKFVLDASETLDINGTGTSLSIANDTEAWLDVTGAGVSITCEGNVSVGASGQMDIDGGLLKLDGSTATTITMATPGAQRDLQNVEIAKTGAGGVTATGSLVTKGNFTISDGTFTFGANTINVAGNFTNSAAGVEGFDASNASATLALDGSGTQQVTSGSDALNIVTCSGSGTVQLMDAMTVGTGIGAGTSLSVTSGMLRLNGQTLSIKPSTTFLFSSSTASPNGALKATVAGATITRSGGAGTFTFAFEEGQIDITNLAFSYADASGFNIAPAAGQNGVRVLNFDGVTFTNGTTRHMTIDDGPGLILTDATWANCSFDNTAAVNIRTLDNSTPNTTPTTTITILNYTGAGAGEAADDDVGTNRITIDWKIEVSLQGAFDGTTDVSWAKNGVPQATYTTNSSPFSFTNISTLNAGDVITVFYEGGVTKGAIVTRATAANMTDLNLVASTLIIRNDNGGDMTNIEIDTAHTGDADIPYTDGGGAALTVASNIVVLVPSGHTYLPGGAVTLQGASGDLTVAGVMTLGGTLTVTGTATIANLLSLAGNNATIATLDNTGTLRMQGNEAAVTITTMDINSGTVEYVGDGGGTTQAHNLKDFGATDYFNLTINDTNGTKDTFAVAGTVTVAGTLTVAGSILNTGANTLVLSGAGLTHRVNTGGEFDMTGAGQIQLADTGIFQVDHNAVTPGVFKSTNASATVTKTGAGAGGFAFRVYGTADITGLTFGNAGSEGLEIGNGVNAPTLTNLSNVTFQNHPGGSGKYLTMRVNGPFDAACPNLTFAAIASGYNVDLADNDNTLDGDVIRLNLMSRGAGAGGGDSRDKDNDTNDDGTPDTGGDSVIQWMYTAEKLSSAPAPVQGAVASAFDLDSGVWYATYALVRDVNATTNDRVLVRTADGDAAYFYDITQADGDVLGPVWWDQEDEAVYGDVNGNGVSTDGKVNVIYIPTSAGKIFKLVDSGGSLAVPGAASAWNTPFEDAAVVSVTSPILSDMTNLYFGGMTIGTNPRVFSVQISNKTLVKNIAGPPSAIRTLPEKRVYTGTTHLFVGSDASAGQAHIYRVNITAGTIPADNISPLHDVKGYMTVVGLTPQRLHVGDAGGRMHGVTADDFAAPLLENIANWPYRDIVNHSVADLDAGLYPINSWPFVDSTTLRVYYGDGDGHFYVLNSDGTLYGDYPVQPASAGYSHPDYYGGVIVVGTADGQVLFLDETVPAGTDGAVIRRYHFGAGKTVTDINYDRGSDTYVVGTSTGDLYYIPWEADPTP